MVKHITLLFSVFLLSYSVLFSSNSESYQFDYIRKDQSGKYSTIVKNDNRYGVVDLFGNEIIKTEYSYINYLQEGYFLVQKDSLYGYFDISGKVILPIEYSYSKVLNYSQTRDYLKADDFYIIHKNGNYGVFDRKKKQVIIPAEYDWIEGQDFSEDVINTSKIKSKSTLNSNLHVSALIYKDKKPSLVDLRTGKTIIDFGVYDQIAPSDKYGLIKVSKNSKDAIVDYQNNIVIPFQNNRLTICQFGFLANSIDGWKVQFISKDNQSKSTEYDDIRMYFNGLSQVVVGREIGIINAQGKEILAPKYDHIYITDDYIEALVYGKSSNEDLKTYFFDIDGKPLLPPLAYDGVEYNTKSKLAVVRNNGREGLVDRKGKLLMPLKYRRIYIDEESNVIRFEVDIKSGVNMGLANMQGKVIVKPRYDKIDNFIDGVAEVGLKTDNDYLHGLINLKGEEILRPQFSSIFFDLDSAKHFAKVYDNNMVGIISRNGIITVIPKYDDIIYQNRTTDDWGNLAITKLNNLYGIVNINTGQIVEEPIYNYVYAIGRNDSLLFCLRSADGNRIINKEGQTIIPLTKDILYPLLSNNDNKYLIRKSEESNEKEIVSTNNKTILPSIYHNITMLNHNLFKVQLDDKIGIVDEQNNIIFPIEYDLIEPYLYPDADLLFAKKGNVYGYIFLDKRTFQPSSFSEIIYKSYKDKGWGL